MNKSKGSPGDSLQSQLARSVAEWLSGVSLLRQLLCRTAGMLLISLSSACVSTSEPVIGVNAADPIPLVDGYYAMSLRSIVDKSPSVDEEMRFLRTFGPGTSFWHEAGEVDLPNIVAVKRLDAQHYLMQYGQPDATRRATMILKVADSGKSAQIMAATCMDDAVVATFSRYGMRASGTKGDCELSNASLERLIGAYSALLRQPQVDWKLADLRWLPPEEGKRRFNEEEKAVGQQLRERRGR